MTMSRKQMKKDELEMFFNQLKLAEKTNTRINNLIRYSIKQIEEEIDEVYYRYKERYNLSDAEMLEYLNKRLTPSQIEKYVETHQWALADITSAKNRITELSLLKGYIQYQTNYIAQESISEVEKLLKFVITDTSGRTHFNTCKAIGLEIEFNRPSKSRIDKLLNHEWLDSTWYNRIQNNCGALQQQVEQVLTDGVLRGKSPQFMANELTKVSHYGYSASERLVRTEVSHFHNKVEAEQYKELGIEKYMIVATLDGRTCSKAHGGKKSCGELDGKVFNLKDKKEGVNYPIFHPNCRCTTIAYIDEDTKKNLQRRAKTKDGKSVVMGYTNYNDWAKDNL